MPVSDDTIVQLANELGKLNGTLVEVVKQQVTQTNLINNHIIDPLAHSMVVPRVRSLEGTRKWFRRSLIAGAVSTPVAGATQLGWMGKILALVKAGAAAGGGQ